MTPPPIAILSFKRADYLKQVLESLKAQAGGGLDSRSVHLFQDGAINRYSRIRYAQDKDISASIDVFKSIFPNGTVHKSPDNIGVCENYRRAEHTLFEECDAEVGYFFEDDLVLSPVYLETMDRLAEWASHMPNVAYFAAYGDYYASAEERIARHAELTNLDHHWGFGLIRRHWRRINALMQPYYEIACGEDYSRRDHRRIYDLYRPYKASPRASSQDAAKAFACDRLGLWRANTVTPYAKYIGDSGQHMTREAYKAIGYSRIEIATHSGRLCPPSNMQLEAYLASQRSIFERIHNEELEELMANLPPRAYNPLRLCEAIDVDYAYSLLLNVIATPENRQHAQGRMSVFELVSELSNSQLFRRLSPKPGTSHLCTPQDVTYIYRLLLHRDPESDSILAAHVNRTDAVVLARDTWNGRTRSELWASICID